MKKDKKIKYVLLLTDLNSTFFCECVKEKTFCKRCQKILKEVHKIIDPGVYAITYKSGPSSFFYYLSKNGKNDKIIKEEDLSLFNVEYKLISDEVLKLLLFKRINSFLYRAPSTLLSISLLPQLSFMKINFVR
jgi:hypothetical protein